MVVVLIMVLVGVMMIIRQYGEEEVDRRGSSSRTMGIILIHRTIAMDHLHLVRCIIIILTIILIIIHLIICIIILQDIHLISTIDIIPIEIDIIMINTKEEVEWLDIVIKEEEAAAEEEVEAVEDEAEVLPNEIEIIGEEE
jgi:hypothetical protein